MSTGSFTPLTPTIETCMLHPFEQADRICGTCGNWHCDACLVSPWGPRKPAMCVACAIERGGVRRHAGAQQGRSTKEIRQLERQRRKEARDAARRPVVVSPVGLPTMDVLDDDPEKPGIFSRFRKTPTPDE